MGSSALQSRPSNVQCRTAAPSDSSHAIDLSCEEVNPHLFQAERFAYLRLIKTEDGFPIQSDVPQDMQQGKFSVENEEEYIRYIRQKAIWFEPHFRKLLQSIVKDLNECALKCDAAGAYATQSEHIAALGIDPSIYKLRFYPSLFRLRGKGAGEARRAFHGSHDALSFRGC